MCISDNAKHEHPVPMKRKKTHKTKQCHHIIISSWKKKRHPFSNALSHADELPVSSNKSFKLNMSFMTVMSQCKPLSTTLHLNQQKNALQEKKVSQPHLTGAAWYVHTFVEEGKCRPSLKFVFKRSF